MAIDGENRDDLHLSREVQKVVVVGGGGGEGIPGPKGPKGDKGDPGDSGKAPAIINNLTTGGTTAILSAEMGKVMNTNLGAASDGRSVKEGIIDAFMQLDPNLGLTYTSTWAEITAAIANIETGGGGEYNLPAFISNFDPNRDLLLVLDRGPFYGKPEQNGQYVVVLGQNKTLCRVLWTTSPEYNPKYDVDYSLGKGKTLYLGTQPISQKLFRYYTDYSQTGFANGTLNSSNWAFGLSGTIDRNGDNLLAGIVYCNTDLTDITEKIVYRPADPKLSYILNTRA
jgi:hypothetical protein